jgi:hypothetical protein
VSDERLEFHWGVKADGEFVALFAWKARAEHFAALGWRDTHPPCRIEVVFLRE